MLLLLSTVLTYLCGLAMGAAAQKIAEPERRRRYQRLAIGACLVINLTILFFFKYYGFFTESIVQGAALLGIKAALPAIDVLLPVGISFYTFQAIGYTIDVYRGEIPVEKNPFRYALFISFFPQLVAGPIERSSNIIPQLYAPHSFDYQRVRRGLSVMLWGFFLKMVVADRLAIFVNGAYESYAQQGGLILIVAAVFFAIQIYCDFAGYSIIALGASEVLGIRLMKNFRQPYLALSIQDFWRRWHISLSTWFRDYIYISLGGNRKGRARKYLNNLLTFLASGLWHGANWTFVMWGFLHGFWIILGDALRPVRAAFCSKLHWKQNSVLRTVCRWSFTFSFVVFAYIFFRAASISEALGYIRQIFTAPFMAGDMFDLGLNGPNFIAAVACIGIVFASDALGLGASLLQRVEGMRPAARNALYLLGLVLIVIFGMYGEGFVEKPFIYFQF